MNILTTDFYQITMCFAYLITGKANDTTAFEAFVRHIKPEINSDKDCYIFKGEQEVHNFMKSVKEEIQSPEFTKIFKKMILSKINPSSHEKYSPMIDEAIEKVTKDFQYSVSTEDSYVFPLVPVFQYNGPKIWGQLIESKLLNIINGKTGAESFNMFSDMEQSIKDKVSMIAGLKPISLEVSEEYHNELEKSSVEFRNSTTKPLFDASFRRAPSFIAAYTATMIAIKNGWNMTSNTFPYFAGELDLDKIGGTMAHAFVMSFETETEAYKVWNEIFPNNTILIDTYDSINAVKILIKENIKPATVRLDSGDLKELSFTIRKMFDEAGWNDVKIFISGDLTPEILSEFEKENVPYDFSMAGTKYVNSGIAQYTNAGFVYKIVQYKSEGKSFQPQKKAEGKFNYPGLKKVSMVDGKMIVANNVGMGIEPCFVRNTEVKFNIS
jgi:nicotinate phosphoribosyltransferase